MSDFHPYIVNDLQRSLEAAVSARDALAERVAVLEAEVLEHRVKARYGSSADLTEMHLDMVELLRENERLKKALGMRLQSGG